jgi:NSS family neurotransmitter:Na+ symporter
MLMLEFVLGQKLQIGNLNVWSKLHPRLYGVGLATSVACYMIVIYYNVIISWALTLFFSSFRSPLPWSVQRTTNKAGTSKDCPGMYITEEFFYRDILHVYNDDCTQYDTDSTMGDGTQFQWQVFLCLMLTWVICFFCVFQGIKIGGKVVWVTVPLPVLLVFIFVMNGFTLKNCDYGFRMYLKGYENDEAPDINKKLQSAGMWSDACAQIFFTLSICIGCMISYASYQPTDAPIITNGFAVSLGNSCFSFFAGFAVFSTVGYLVGLNSPVATKVSSIGLAFIAYPAAIETMPAANFWALLLSITLFTLGVDSAFAMVEGTVTVICDSPIGKKQSKFVIALVTCLVGAVFSTVFCFNWGFTFFDVIDHYLNVYLVLIMGILQSVVAGWIHCFEDSMATSRIATLAILIPYWAVLIPIAWLSYFAWPNESWTGLVIFWGCTIISWVVSALLGVFVSKLTFKQWYEQVFFAGVRPMAHTIAETQGKIHWVYKRIFEYWWCMSIKYIFPWAMYWLIIMTVQADTDNRYGNYNLGW